MVVYRSRVLEALASNSRKKGIALLAGGAAIGGLAGYYTTRDLHYTGAGVALGFIAGELIDSLINFSLDRLGYTTSGKGK